MSSLSPRNSSAIRLPIKLQVGAGIAAWGLALVAGISCVSVPEYDDPDPILRQRFELAKQVCLRFSHESCAHPLNPFDCFHDRMERCMLVQGYARQRLSWRLNREMHDWLEIKGVLRSQRSAPKR